MASVDPHISGRYMIIAAFIGLIGTLGGIYLNHYLGNQANRGIENNMRANSLTQKDTMMLEDAPVEHDVQEEERPVDSALEDDSSDEREKAKGEEAIREADSPPPPAEKYEQTSPTTSGKYMVIAGSFRQRSAAESHMTRLKNLGYISTEVRIFDRGSFSVVVVDRFNTLSKAKNLVTQLADDGIEAIVSTKS